MTLILTCLTDSAVIQISDRRLSRLGDDPVTVVTDDTVKVVLADNWLYGYTGLANLNGMPTHHWLAERLARRGGQRHGDCLADIWGDAEDAIDSANKRYPRFAPIAQAFVGAGWYADTITGEYFPSLYQISNFHDASGRACQVGPFTCTYRALQSDEKVHVNAIGARVTDSEISRLSVAIGKLIARSRGVQSIGRLLFEFMRMMHDRDKTVGDNLLLSCVPISQFRTQMSGGLSLFMTGLPESDKATFCSFSSTGRSAISEAPVYVMNGSIINSFSAGPPAAFKA